ncbi:M14 family zinc carboxypeptidase [Sutcliffiella halmapala]|uniref:M14 family zinc carboxypeptidase n=1 Tax=Sutcliffiella halmapala TaxID=79882 RepID=UPI000995B6BB|nr:M14 family zinc carboxypeptidase [Sutcliffiella halmapala]
MQMKTVIILIILINILPYQSYANFVNAQEWYTYERMVEDLKGLKRKYRNDMQIDSIGKSEFGKNIWAIKVGTGEPSIIILAGHHGREWLTTSLVMTKLEHYLDAYSKKESKFGYDSAILDEVAIWFVPMVNPDGIRIQQEGISFLPKYMQNKLIQMNENSKNFERWKANGKGLDLNRQYPTGWSTIKEQTSVPSYQFYKGKFPLQAKETRAIVRFTRQTKPLMAVTYHSSGRVLYWNFNNDKAVVKRDLAIAKELSNMTGYQLDYPQEHAVGGGFSDWFVSEFKRPSFTPEISYPVQETNPPLAVFYEEWNRNKKVGFYLATKSKKLFLSSNETNVNEEE